jgi:flagellar basal-body rod protein FlgC
MLKALDISTSGLTAQRQRMLVRSSNLANMSTTHNEAGERIPYKPRFVVFKSDDSIGANGAAGVTVSSVETSDIAPRLKYEPDNPEANTDGYVAYPNINMIGEMTDAMEAARSYEANLGAFEMSKQMEEQTLRLLA